MLLVEVHSNNHEKEPGDENDYEEVSALMSKLVLKDNDPSSSLPPSSSQQQQHQHPIEIDDDDGENDYTQTSFLTSIIIPPASLCQALETKTKEEMNRLLKAPFPFIRWRLGGRLSLSSSSSSSPIITASELVAYSMLSYPTHMNLDLLYRLTSRDCCPVLSPSFGAPILLLTECRLLLEDQKKQTKLMEEEEQFTTTNDEKRYDEIHRSKLLSHLQIRCITSIVSDLKSFYQKGLNNMMEHKVLLMPNENDPIDGGSSEDGEIFNECLSKTVLWSFVQELPRQVVIAMIVKICEDVKITGEETDHELIRSLFGLIQWKVRIATMPKTSSSILLPPLPATAFSTSSKIKPKPTYNDYDPSSSFHFSQESTTTKSSAASSSSLVLTSPVCEEIGEEEDEGRQISVEGNRVRFNSCSCICPENTTIKQQPNHQQQGGEDDCFDLDLSDDEEEEEDDHIMGLHFLENTRNNNCNVLDRHGGDNHYHRHSGGTEEVKGGEYYPVDPSHKPPVEYIYVVRCVSSVRPPPAPPALTPPSERWDKNRKAASSN